MHYDSLTRISSAIAGMPFCLHLLFSLRHNGKNLEARLAIRSIILFSISKLTIFLIQSVLKSVLPSHVYGLFLAYM